MVTLSENICEKIQQYDLSHLGEYDVLLVDPPWEYDYDGRHITCNGVVNSHYNCLSIDELKKFVLPAKKDSMLFLWCTSVMLPYSFEVINSWGFKYRASAIWDKCNPVSHKRISGMGNYFWINHEFLLLCKRGNVKRPVADNRFGSIFKGIRREHSHKPEIVYDMIEQMYPGTSKIELFARRRREGWAAWGNQVQTTMQKTLRSLPIEG